MSALRAAGIGAANVLGLIALAVIGIAEHVEARRKGSVNA